MRSPLPTICKKAPSQKIIVHLLITGHGRATSTPSQSQEVLMGVRSQGPIQDLRQIRGTLINPVLIRPLPGRTIVFQILAGKPKPIQAPAGQTAILNQHGQPVLIHRPHDLRAVTPLQSLQAAVQVEAGLQAAVPAVGAGHPVEGAKEAGKYLQSII